MQVFISADIEGVTGIVSWSQAEGPGASSFDWAFARRMYTHDVNAAIRGAKAAGAKRVVVKDSHGLCKNLLIDELEPGTELISGFGATPHGMMGAFSRASMLRRSSGTTPWRAPMG
jgi:D-amino peptidase